MKSLKKEIKNVGICVVTHNNYFQTKFFIENLLENTNGYAKLYVYDYGSIDSCLLHYLEKVCNDNNGEFKAVKNPKSLASFYNQILKEVDEDYLAFVPIDTLLPDNWLAECLYHYENVENSGCISIRNQFDDLELHSILFKNAKMGDGESRLVYFKPLNVVDNLMFFSKSRLKKVGKFDENFKYDGFLFNEFSFRFVGNGYDNYWVKNAAGVKVFIEDNIIQPPKQREGYEALKNEINKMVKQHKFKK